MHSAIDSHVHARKGDMCQPAPHPCTHMIMLLQACSFPLLAWEDGTYQATILLGSP